MVLTPLSTKQHSDPIVLISNRTVAAPEIKQNLLLLTVSQLPVTHSVPAQGGKKKGVCTLFLKWRMAFELK